jgi:Zn-dependent protease
MMLDDLNVATLVARMVTLLVAFTVHELAHAVTADYLGDPTSRNMGRITLNPIKHLDPFGTIMLLLAGFGWAKPVMVNPMNMRGNPRTSMAIVAVAGPLSNIVLAILTALVFRLELANFTLLPPSGTVPPLDYLLSTFIWINLILAFFNLIPVPPLDGSKILYAFLPAEIVFRLRPVEQFGFIILIGIIFFFPTVLNVLVQLPAVTTLQFLLG